MMSTCAHGNGQARADLLPAVREATQDTLLITDGYACREQTAQSSGRGALHLAEVLNLALRHGPHGTDRLPPERACPRW